MCLEHSLFYADKGPAPGPAAVPCLLSVDWMSPSTVISYEHAEIRLYLPGHRSAHVVTESLHVGD